MCTNLLFTSKFPAQSDKFNSITAVNKPKNILRPPSPQNLQNCLHTISVFLYSAFENEPDWPDVFVKAYIDDSLNDRIWVDHPLCKDFVDNIQTAFYTKPIPFSIADTIQPTTTPSGEFQLLKSAEDSELTEIGDLMDITSGVGKRAQILAPRYVSMRNEIEVVVADIIRNYIASGNKLRPQIKRTVLNSTSAVTPAIDNRNFLKLLQNACGFAEIRSIAMSKMEVWMHNPKV